MTSVVDPVVARWRQLLSGSQSSGGTGHQRKERKVKQQEQHMQSRLVNVNSYQQLAISGTAASHTTEAWGDALTGKRDGICRIGLLNPSGFTLTGGSAKDNQLQELMKTMEADVMCFPEVNVCWHKLAPCNRLEERTMGWFEMLHRSVSSYNS